MFRILNTLKKTLATEPEKEQFVNFKRNSNAIIGANFETSTPSQAPILTKNWIENLNYRLELCKTDDEKLSEILNSHIEFERIHPFSDGNGRTGRLIMLYLCFQEKISPFVIEKNDRRGLPLPKIIEQEKILNYHVREELEKAFDIYLSNNEDFVSTLSESQLKFLQTSVKGISENYDNIKDTIKANTQNWAYERIGLVERTLLIIATYEFLKANTPIEVVANETVELAKEYGNEKSYEFVNGILANIGKTK